MSHRCEDCELGSPKRISHLREHSEMVSTMAGHVLEHVRSQNPGAQFDEHTIFQLACLITMKFDHEAMLHMQKKPDGVDHMLAHAGIIAQECEIMANQLIESVIRSSEITKGIH